MSLRPCRFTRVCTRPITDDDITHNRVVHANGAYGHIECGTEMLRLHREQVMAGIGQGAIPAAYVPVLNAAASRAVRGLDLTGTGSILYDFAPAGTG